MKKLAYDSEESYLEHSKKISEQLPNMKLSTIRKAIANADHYRTVKSYREALRIFGEKYKPTGCLKSEHGVLTIELKAGLPYGLERYYSYEDQEDLIGRLKDYLGGEKNGFRLQEIDTDLLENGEYLISGAFKLDCIENSQAYIEQEEEILEHLFMSAFRTQFTAFNLAEEVYKASINVLGNSCSNGINNPSKDQISDLVELPTFNPIHIVECLSSKLAQETRFLAVRYLQAKNHYLHENDIIEKQAEFVFLTLCEKAISLLVEENMNSLSRLPKYEETSTLAFMIAKRIIVK